MQRDVRSLLPGLSRSQANVLGELVFAMLMVDGCGMTRICSYVSDVLGQAMNTLRQKYREIYYEKEAKAGVKKGRCKRRELVVEELFADLLAKAPDTDAVFCANDDLALGVLFECRRRH